MSGDSGKMIVQKFNVDMTLEKLACLKNETCLNDEVINFYMEMLQERDNCLCSLRESTRRRSSFFNTFFYSRLMENGIFTYNNVHSWTKTLNIFELENIYIPIHLKDARHWVSVVVKPQLKRIEFFDSMYDSDNKEGGMDFMRNVLNWIVLQAKMNLQRTEKPDDWTLLKLF